MIRADSDLPDTGVGASTGAYQATGAAANRVRQVVGFAVENFLTRLQPEEQLSQSQHPKKQLSWSLYPEKHYRLIRRPLYPEKLHQLIHKLYVSKQWRNTKNKAGETK